VHLGGRTDENAFRPPLASFPPDARYELKNARVEGCTFVGGQAAVGFVGVDGAVVRYNTIYRPENYAIRILQERAGDGFVSCRGEGRPRRESRQPRRGQGGARPAGGEVRRSVRAGSVSDGKRLPVAHAPGPDGICMRRPRPPGVISRGGNQAHAAPPAARPGG